MTPLPDRHYYCKKSKECDFDIYEDKVGHVVINTVNGTYMFSKRSKAIKYIEESVKLGMKLPTSYPLDVLKQDKAELGESKGLEVKDL